MALYQGKHSIEPFEFLPTQNGGGGDAIETHAWRHCGGSRAARELGKLQR